MLIATYRPDEPSSPPARAGVAHPLRDVTRSLLACGLSQELSMRFLDEARCAEYLVARFPGADLPHPLARGVLGPKLSATSSRIVFADHARFEGERLLSVDLEIVDADTGIVRTLAKDVDPGDQSP